MHTPPKPKLKRSSKSQPAFDPSEIDDLILTPAVGTGVGSHLIPGGFPHNATPVGAHQQAIGVTSRMATVVSHNTTTVVPSEIWVTDAGDPVAASRVSAIGKPTDVLNATELAVYEMLWSHPGATEMDGCRTTQVGYQELIRSTRLSKKTIQRVIDRLTAKQFISIEKPAAIYDRTPTVYRVYSFPAVLRKLSQEGRGHVTRIGPGIVYVRPLASSG